ncbi:MAG: response regulator [Gammaproteobacteria bacterium]|nr:response regulator [Gammaproteobacteria bacterium]
MTHDWSPRVDARDSATILVAEDHHDSREALRILLESAGYRVAVAVDGRDALDVALLETPDLILMDIMMPELDGFEVTRRLRSHAATGAVPIIAVTAMQGAREMALEAGADDVMAKPIDIHALLAKVRDWLDRCGRV